MSYETTDPAGAKALLDGEDEWTYVDVRSVEEFEAGHVPGAYNVPILFRGPQGMEPNPDFVATMKRHFPAESRLVLGCKAGGRSERACELLAGAGYAHLVNMFGGFHGALDQTGRVVQPGWAACGFPQAAEAAPGRTWSELSG